MLKEDTDLSRDFQSILEMNYEIEKMNEDFDYPVNFLDNVEEKILVMMDADNNQKKEKERRLRVIFGYSVASVPAFLVLLILTTFNFGNLQVNLNKTGNYSSNSPRTSQATEPRVENLPVAQSHKVYAPAIRSKATTNTSFNIASESTTDNYIANENISSEVKNSLENSGANSISVDNNSKLAISDSQKETNLTNSELKQIDFDQKITNTISEVKTLNGTQISSATNNSQQLLTPNSSVQLANQPTQDFNAVTQTFSTGFSSFASTIKSNDAIVLNSFFGSDIAAFGVSNADQVISSFTQSIGAKVDDFTQLGLETGFMEFSGEQSHFTFVNKSGSTGGQSLILNNSDDDGNLIRIPGTQLSNKRLFWAGIFYERNLLDLDKFSISSRMSLGGSDIGFVSSLKFIGRYRLLNKLELTMGADAKLFNGTEEIFVSKNSVSSTISLIYGIHFAF